MPKQKTQNDGASQERAAIKRYVSKLSKATYDATIVGTCERILEFINTRTKRTAAHKGGLGKR